jgi:hypothetical protein
LEFLLSGDNSPDWASVDHNLAQFSILGQGATLGEAVDLKTIGRSTRVVSGTMDPNDYRAAVDLYAFTLAAGHFWQVSLAVDTQSMGSPLLPALSLFDAQGHVLETRDAGSGSLENPTDPYLILGLQPGTYFVGISGAGDLPNARGGYEPITGSPGTVGRSQPGGPFPFQLDLRATPVITSTSLVRFQVEHADPLEPSPTGLDLTFSGPIDVSSLVQPDHQQKALEVVDSEGESWPATALDYDPSTDHLRLILNEALPAGTYSLIVPPQGGLTDLAGQPVVAPAGNPSGVLGSWTVAPAPVAPPSGPGISQNLGVIWPGSVNVTWQATTIGRTTQLDPGQDPAYRFFVICPGIYKVEAQIGGTQVASRLEGGGATTVLDSGNVDPLNDYLVTLNPGEYRLHFQSLGAQPVQVQWTLEPIALDYEKILDNGVHQLAATSLSPIEVQASGSNPSSPGSPAPLPSPSTTPGPTASTPSTGPEPGTGSPTAATLTGAGPNSSTVTVNGAPIPAGLLVTLNTSVVGLPSATAQHVAAVGPAAEGGSIALADSAAGLLPGIRYGSLAGAEDRLGAGEAPVGADVAVAGPIVASAAGLPARDGADLDSGRLRADAQALARADWLVRIAALLGETIAPASAPVEQPVLLATTAPAAVASTLSQPANPPSDPAGIDPADDPWRSVAHADLGAPISLVVALACTYRLRGPLRKWWRRPGPAAPTVRQLPRFLARGPHFGPCRATAPRRSRKVCVPS